MIDSQAFLIIQQQDRPRASKTPLTNVSEKKTEFEGFPAGCWGLRDSSQASWGANPPVCPAKRWFHLGLSSFIDQELNQGAKQSE